ncbi:diaminopimelate decarboxylase [Lacipirellula parvula]|uniref:Diaminopimelate decarboxylase n=1 Tax=Lacipirellula parvula TaxID=2650471 RepID=A0A5K7XQJ8_9BACT|nr:diaminopimelate decarboxylase [Lacipirellula parvula]BBO35939.1 diaminopimelate decarboxylase [Lacipirellula parvula]
MPAAAAAKFPLTVTEVAGQSVVELAKKFGTPLFVYDAAIVAERVADLAVFDVVRYAQKACSNLAILDVVRRSGGVVDAVSAGEIQRALAAGFKPGFAEPPQIVYTADIFDREALELVAKHEIPVNCGSPDMIDQYGTVCPGRGITLRINPGFGHGHSQKTNTGGQQSKHGIWHSQLADCVERAKRNKLSIAGLHMHIGSGTDMEHLSQVCGAMEAAALSVGSSIHSISAGGGLPTPYREGDKKVDIGAYYELWNGVRERLAAAFGHPVSLEIEPGRYLSAEAGSLIAEIRAVKKMGDNLFYVVDAGFNNLARPILYGAYHPMAVAYASGKSEGATQPVIVGGPLCESGDIFTQEDGGYVRSRDLPVAAIGDYVVIGVAGAYGAVMGSNYNSKPLAAEVMVEKGKVHLVRERQTFADIIRGEHIPK